MPRSPSRQERIVCACAPSIPTSPLEGRDGEEGSAAPTGRRWVSRRRCPIRHSSLFSAILGYIGINNSRATIAFRLPAEAGGEEISTGLAWGHIHRHRTGQHGSRHVRGPILAADSPTGTEDHPWDIKSTVKTMPSIRTPKLNRRHSPCMRLPLWTRV